MSAYKKGSAAILDRKSEKDTDINGGAHHYLLSVTRIMAGIKGLIIESKLENLHRVVENGKQKFLCFTRLTSCWILCVTDGVDVWRVELDEDDIESYRELAEVNGMDAFLAKIRKGFVDGDLSVAIIGTKVTLTIGKGATSFNFDLYEVKAAEKKTEIQCVLFRLADTTADLESEVSKANKTIENLKAQRGGGSGPAFMDLGPKKAANQAKVKPKKTGMSVINPTSKKRKAATGVVFD